MMKIFKKPIFIIISVVCVILVIYFWSSSSKKPTYQTATVEIGDVIQEVSVTGQVKTGEKIDLAFEKGGRISFVNIEEGDKVYPGQILIRLANADIVAQLSQAQADVKAQQAKLDELVKGTRPEEIQVQEAKVANAEVDLENAKRDLVDKLQDAYTKSDDAIRNKVDQFFDNPRGSSPQLTFSIDDFQLEIDVEQRRLEVEKIFTSWKTALDQLTVSSDLDSYVATAKNNLDQIKMLLDKTALVINSAESSTTLTQTTINGWKSDVSAGRTNFNTAVVNLSAAENEFKNSQSDLALANQELILEKAGSTPEQIAAQEAEVEQAEASVQNYQAQLDKTILRSPINGVVASQDVNVGEIIAANTALVSLISENNFKIEANIPETDIAKVKIGDYASITLDAYGNDVIFDANVFKINPAETLIEGVATYKTTFYFAKADSRVKPGMTANIDILTDKRENVLVVPQRVVISRNGGRFVLFDKGSGKTEEKEIKLGLRGSDGKFEVLSGLNKGDVVVSP